MKKILLTLAAVVCAAAMMAQEKLLQGDQLMDRNQIGRAHV